MSDKPLDCVARPGAHHDFKPALTEEQALIEQIEILKRAYMKEAKPLLDRLGAIYANRMPPVYILEQQMNPIFFSPGFELGKKDAENN